MQKTQRPGTLQNKIYTGRDHSNRPRNMPTDQSGPRQSTVCQTVCGTSPQRHSACKDQCPCQYQPWSRAPVLPLHDRICAVVLNSLPPQHKHCVISIVFPNTPIHVIIRWYIKFIQQFFRRCFSMFCWQFHHISNKWCQSTLQSWKLGQFIKMYFNHFHLIKNHAACFSSWNSNTPSPTYPHPSSICLPNCSTHQLMQGLHPL